MYAIHFLLMLLAMSFDLAIDGVVRARGTSEPVPGVLVELVDQGISARTDSSGAYAMRGVRPGSHRIQFSRLGYRSFTTEVSVVDRAPLHVDVNLSVDPQWLDTMRIVVAKPPMVSAPLVRQAYEPGSFDLTLQEIGNNPLHGRIDALRDLAASPDVQLDPDTPLGLYVRGGTPDQNVVRIDGVPVRAVAHSGETFSTIGADLVKSVSLHTGAPSASMGGAISSIVDIRTVDATELSLRAEIDHVMMRGSANIPLLANGRAGITVGGGQSYDRTLRLLGESEGAPSVWQDRFVGMHVSNEGTQLRVFAMTSADALALPPVVDCDVTQSCMIYSPPIVRVHNFTWSGSTLGSELRQKLGARTSATVRFWNGKSDARLPARGSQPEEYITSHLLDRGAIAEVETHGSYAQLKTGIELESLDAACIHSAAAPPVSAPLGGCLGAQRLATGAAYVESAFELSTHLHARVGARATTAHGLAPEIEPRVVIEASPAHWLHLAAGYSESHQLLQSLRNYESPLSDVVGAEIPVIADGGAIPVAESRDISASARITLEPATEIRLDAYTRRMTGIFARTSDGLFAIDDPAPGRERARGLGLMLRHTGRATVTARYSLMSARIHANDVDFAPRFVPSQTAALGLRYNLTSKTTLRGSSWIVVGRTARLLTGQVEVEWEDVLSRVREIGGTGALDMSLSPAKLPNYVRFDFGIEHELSLTRSKNRLRIAFNVDNLLGRANVGSWLRSPAAGIGDAVPMIPLSANLSLHWAY